MTKNVILEDADGEELIPYTNLATSSIAGRVRPDNSTIAVDTNGVISVNGVTGGEIGYLSGVTSAIQTQINNCVHLSGSETITGTKTYSVSPLVPTPASSDNSQKAANTGFISNKFQVVSALPASPDNNIFYFIVEE